MLEKVWLVVIKGKIYGPYSFNDLKSNMAITPETWAKKVEWKEWKKIKDISELDKLFEEQEEEENKDVKISSQHEGVMSEISLEPGHFLLWIFIVIIIFLYFMYKMYAD